MEWLTAPLEFEFMRNALMAGILAGMLCPVVGALLIVQRMTLLGDVMAHSVLPGIVIAFFLRIEVLVGAMVSAVLSALAIAWVRQQTRVKEDAAMATIFHSFFAVGILLITVLRVRVNVESFLFGDLLGVTGTDVVRTAVITAVVLTLVKLSYKELLFYTFDPVGAQAVGLPVGLIYSFLIGGITLTIIASMQTMGVILVVSLLAIPALSAYFWVKELHEMMLVGMGIGVLASSSGLYISYYLGLPSGATIVLVNFAVFLVSVLLSPSQGLLSIYRQNLR
ncbi:MAG: metal ABC transporter permease [Pseudanabaenaceae cyanobacterium]